MRKVHSGEGNIALVPAMPGPHRDCGSRAERQTEARPSRSWPRSARCTGHAAGIRGEDVVEQPGSGQEILVVRRVFLVPEDRGDSLLPAPLDQLPELVTGSVGAGQLATPQPTVTGPGRLDEHEVNGSGRQDAAPGVGVHGAGGPLVAEGQARKSRPGSLRPGRPGRDGCVLREGGRNQREPAFAPPPASRPLPRPERCGARRSPVRSAHGTARSCTVPNRLCGNATGAFRSSRRPGISLGSDVRTAQRTSVATRFALASSRILAAEMLLPFDRCRVKSW